MNKEFASLDPLSQHTIDLLAFVLFRDRRNEASTPNTLNVEEDLTTGPDAVAWRGSAEARVEYRSRAAALIESLAAVGLKIAQQPVKLQKNFETLRTIPEQTAY